MQAIRRFIFDYFFSMASVSLSFLLALSRLYANGVARNTEENVPAVIPTNRAKMNPLIVSPPKKKMASNTTKVDPDVLNERVRVELTAEIILFFQVVFGWFLTFSRIRSKMTTVALME